MMWYDEARLEANNPCPKCGEAGELRTALWFVNVNGEERLEWKCRCGHGYISLPKDASASRTA